jgi:ribonucleoside-triphosphate reductase
VSFLYRTDPTKTAKDLGYLYLPQEVVDEEAYTAYASTLKPLEGAPKDEIDEQEFKIDTGSECSTGMCPVR